MISQSNKNPLEISLFSIEENVYHSNTNNTQSIFSTAKEFPFTQKTYKRTVDVLTISQIERNDNKIPRTDSFNSIDSNANLNETVVGARYFTKKMDRAAKGAFLIPDYSDPI